MSVNMYKDISKEIFLKKSRRIPAQAEIPGGTAAKISGRILPCVSKVFPRNSERNH